MPFRVSNYIRKGSVKLELTDGRIMTWDIAEHNANTHLFIDDKEQLYPLDSARILVDKQMKPEVILIYAFNTVRDIEMMQSKIAMNIFDEDYHYPSKEQEGT